MALATEKVAETFLSIVSGVAIDCDWPLYAEDEVEVVYGFDSLETQLNVDYTVTLSAPNYDQFTVTPTATLLSKINALIAADTLGVEINYITVRRKLDYLTSTTPGTIGNVTFLSREIERIHMRLIQLAELGYRSILFPPKSVGEQNVPHYIEEPIANAVPVWDPTGTKLINGPDADAITAAQTYATEGLVYKDAAAASALEAALQAARLIGTSTTSLAIAVTEKIFTTQTDKLFIPGTWVMIVSDANPTVNYMHGQVTSYSDTTLTVNVTNVGGSGTLADWTIVVAGTRGAQGPMGAPGAGTGDMLGANNLADVADAAASRSSLGLGSAAVQAAGYFVQVANNLSDLASAATAFNNIKQAASATATGVVELATPTEVIAGTDTTRAATPEGVAAALATVAPGLVYLGTVTASGVASKAIQSLITSAYPTHRVELRNLVPVSGSTQLYVSCSANNGSSYLGTNNGLMVEDTSASTTRLSIADATRFQMNQSLIYNNAAYGAVQGHVDIKNTNGISSIEWSISFGTTNSSGGWVHAKGVGKPSRGGSSTVNALKFEFSSGNISTGTFDVYGVRGA